MELYHSIHSCLLFTRPLYLSSNIHSAILHLFSSAPQGLKPIHMSLFFHVMNKHEIWKMMGFYSCRVYDFKMAKKFSSLSITENLDVKLTCYFNAFFSSVYNARSCHCQGIYSYLSYREKAIMCRFISFFSSPVLRHTFCYADIGCKFIQLCPEANWTQGFHI